jgi:hypothetical protein
MSDRIELRPRTRWAADGPQIQNVKPTIVVAIDTEWGDPMVSITIPDRSDEPWFMSAYETADLILALQGLVSSDTVQSYLKLKEQQ